MLKTVWLYINDMSNGLISTITLMGNPAIWWVGFSLMISAFWRGVKNGEKPFLYLSILYIFQLIPYSLISRNLFLYHYYLNVPIIILAISGMIYDSWKNSTEKKFIIIYLSIVAAIFFIFYPVISGLPIPVWYRDLLRFNKNWIF